MIFRKDQATDHSTSRCLAICRAAMASIRQMRNRLHNQIQSSTASWTPPTNLRTTSRNTVARPASAKPSSTSDAATQPKRRPPSTKLNSPLSRELATAKSKSRRLQSSLFCTTSVAVSHVLTRNWSRQAETTRSTRIHWPDSTGVHWSHMLDRQSFGGIGGFRERYRDSMK